MTNSSSGALDDVVGALSHPTRRVEGRMHTLSLDPKPFREVERWLERYAQAWRTRLDRLDAYLEENP